jgi:hypothetical protein
MLAKMSVAAFLLLTAIVVSAAGFQFSDASGRVLMQQVYDTHKQYPYVYEEQSLVLIDRDGNRETRKVKLYSRMEPASIQRFLVLLESPEDVKGVAVLAERNANGDTRQAIYLPALGESMIENSGGAGDTNFLGTDFSIENLTGERLEDYDYRRRRDELINYKMYSVVDVFDKPSEADQTALRRHYISQEILYLTRTDYFDDLGRVRKRQSSHDMTQVLGDMWRANMLLMEDLQNGHKTLIKINRRIFSKEYVPAEVFTAEHLYANSRIEGLVDYDLQDDATELELSGETEQ